MADCHFCGQWISQRFEECPGCQSPNYNSAKHKQSRRRLVQGFFDVPTIAALTTLGRLAKMAGAKAKRGPHPENNLRELYQFTLDLADPDDAAVYKILLGIVTMARAVIVKQNTDNPLGHRKH